MDGDTTLEEAREYIEDHKWDTYGTNCPCCRRKVKVWKHRLHSGMLRALADHYHAHDTRCGHERWNPSGHFAKLRFWGMVEKCDGQGMWRVTDHGRLFLLDMVAVPSHVLIDRGTCLGYWEDAYQVTASDVWGNPFDADDLLR